MDGEIMRKNTQNEGSMPVLEGNEFAADTMHITDIDRQVATARRYPRNLKKVCSDLVEIVSINEDVASSMLYKLPREDKDIEGPSIRFAEALAQCYGNCKTDARVIEINRNEKYVNAEAVFFDFEKNTETRRTAIRRISNKHGRLMNDDMIALAGNAACSIALRKAILGGVASVIWQPAYDAALKVVAGDQGNVQERFSRAVEWFKARGVTEQQLLNAIRVSSRGEVKPKHLVALSGMRSALLNNEATIAEMFEKEPQPVNPLED